MLDIPALKHNKIISDSNALEGEERISKRGTSFRNSCWGVKKHMFIAFHPPPRFSNVRGLPLTLKIALPLKGGGCLTPFLTAIR